MRANGASRAIAVAGLSMGQLLPAMFLSAALPAIYREQGLDLRSLWIFFLPQLPAWIKWLWAPLLDQYASTTFGRRKSWLLPTTILAAAIYLVLTIAEPTLGWLNAIITLLVVRSFITSVLDVAVDAYTVEAYAAAPRTGASVVALAEQIAPVLATSVLMVIYARYGWDVAIIASVGCLVLCNLPALIRSEDAPATAQVEKPSLIRSVARPDSPWILAAVPALTFAIYFPMLADGVFLVDRGFTLEEIGLVIGLGQGSGFLLGLAAAPWLMARASAHILLPVMAAAAPLAQMGLSLPGMDVGVPIAGLAYFASALLVSPFIVSVNAHRLVWADRGQSATDYALQSAAARVGYSAAGAAAGFSAAGFGWTGHYGLAAAILSAAALMLGHVAGRIAKLNKSPAPSLAQGGNHAT